MMAALSKLFSFKAQHEARAKAKERAELTKKRERIAWAEDVLLSQRTDYGKALYEGWRRSIEKGLDALEGANDFEKGVLATYRRILRDWERDSNEAQEVLNGEARD